MRISAIISAFEKKGYFISHFSDYRYGRQSKVYVVDRYKFMRIFRSYASAYRFYFK